MDINTKLRIKSIFLKVIIITVVMMFIGSVVVYGEPLLISDLDAYEMEPPGPTPARTLGIAIDIIQIISMFAAFGLFIYCIVNKVSSTRKVKKEIQEIEAKQIDVRTDEENKKMEFLEKKLRKLRNSFALALFICVILVIELYVLEIVTEFTKPIIYIYPTEDNQEISIKLSNPDDITCSYPKYDNGWNIIADKDGTIKLKDSSREYYSLYWEGNNRRKNKIEEGFVVKGEDIAVFLEEKLSILGLNDREAEEFIVYWLPEMEKNKYNLIRFMPIDEFNQENELIINPKPDTLIRVMMEYKPLSHKIDIPEQQLEPVVRTGYTVVEWGGTRIK